MEYLVCLSFVLLVVIFTVQNLGISTGKLFGKNANATNTTTLSNNLTVTTGTGAIIFNGAVVGSATSDLKVTSTTGTTAPRRLRTPSIWGGACGILVTAVQP